MLQYRRRYCSIFAKHYYDERLGASRKTPIDAEQTPQPQPSAFASTDETMEASDASQKSRSRNACEGESLRVPKTTHVLQTTKRFVLHDIPRIAGCVAIIPDTTWCTPVSNLRAGMQVTIVREIIPVIRAEFLDGHLWRDRDLDFDVRLFVTEHGMFVESDVDLRVRFVGAIIFATVGGIVDGDDVAPSKSPIAGMLGKVESLGRRLAT